MASRASLDDLQNALLTRLKFVFHQHAKKACGSKTLAEAMTVTISSDLREIVLFVPHYWALPYHEGHGPVENTKMIFFPNPADDPRIAGGYPVRRSEVQHLTPDEFKSLRDKFVMIRKRRRMPGNKFFVRGTEEAQESGDAPFTTARTLDEFMDINFPPTAEAPIVLFV